MTNGDDGIPDADGNYYPKPEEFVWHHTYIPATAKVKQNDTNPKDFLVLWVCVWLPSIVCTLAPKCGETSLSAEYLKGKPNGWRHKVPTARAVPKSDSAKCSLFQRDLYIWRLNEREYLKGKTNASAVPGIVHPHLVRMPETHICANATSNISENLLQKWLCTPFPIRHFLQRPSHRFCIRPMGLAMLMHLQ